MQRSTSSTGTLAIATMFLATVLHILWLGAAQAQSPMPEVDTDTETDTNDPQKPDESENPEKKN